MGIIPNCKAEKTIGKYTLLEKLGEGRLGPVYKGLDQTNGATAAIRILCDGIKWDAQAEELFKQKANAAARLKHPNISPIFEIGKQDNAHFIAMEALDAPSLKNLTTQGDQSISVEAKLSLIIQIADALGFAHKNGILHHDLNPEKIHLIEGRTIRIRDFAIANALKESLPHPVVRWGSPVYLCPEQIQQQGYDERSDIFIAGIIFFELLSGVHPFYHQDSNKALDRILLDAPIAEIEKFTDLPPGTWPILRKCLAVRPDDRYGSADEISKECKALLKSIAEDVDLMRSELYSSISPLRKAARHVDAAPGLIRLLEETEKLLNGGEADYAMLDRLTTSLLEHYPDIQAAAGEATPLNPVRLAPPKCAAAPANHSPSETKPMILPPPPVFDFLNEHYEDKSDFAGITPIEGQSKMGAKSQEINFAVVTAPKRNLRFAKKLLLVSFLIAASAMAGFFCANIWTGGRNLSAGIRNQVANKLSSAFSAGETAPPTSETGANAQKETDQSSAESMLKIARVLMNENRLEESKIILRKILEADPAYEPALAALNELIALSNVDKTGKDAEGLRKGIRNISALLNADNLQSAQVELEKLQKAYPESTALYPLKKRWHEKASAK